jgi:hypothetical protein
MTHTKVFDETGERVVEIQEDGEIVWTEDDSVRRDKISDQSKKDLIQDIENGDLEAYARKTFEILTGETIKEAKQ